MVNTAPHDDVRSRRLWRMGTGCNPDRRMAKAVPHDDVRSWRLGRMGTGCDLDMGIVPHMRIVQAAVHGAARCASAFVRSKG